MITKQIGVCEGFEGKKEENLGEKHILRAKICN